MSIQSASPGISAANPGASSASKPATTGGPAGRTGAGPSDSVQLSGATRSSQPTTIPHPDENLMGTAAASQSAAPVATPVNGGSDLPANVQNPDAFEANDHLDDVSEPGLGENTDGKEIPQFTRHIGPSGKTGVGSGTAPDLQYADKPPTKLGDPNSVTGNMENTVADKGCEKTAKKASEIAAAAIKGAVRSGAMSAEAGAQALKAAGPAGFAASAAAGAATGLHGLYKACKDGTAEDQRKAALTLLADFGTGGAYSFIHDAFASPDRPLTAQEKSVLGARTGLRADVNPDSGRLPG